MPDNDNRPTASADAAGLLLIAAWNNAIEAAASNLETSYPNHKWVNAYCASIRMLRK